MNTFEDVIWTNVAHWLDLESIMAVTALCRTTYWDMPELFHEWIWRLGKKLDLSNILKHAVVMQCVVNNEGRLLVRNNSALDGLASYYGFIGKETFLHSSTVHPREYLDILTTRDIAVRYNMKCLTPIPAIVYSHPAIEVPEVILCRWMNTHATDYLQNVANHALCGTLTSQHTVQVDNVIRSPYTPYVEPFLRYLYCTPLSFGTLHPVELGMLRYAMTTANYLPRSLRRDADPHTVRLLHLTLLELHLTIDVNLLMNATCMGDVLQSMDAINMWCTQGQDFMRQWYIKLFEGTALPVTRHMTTMDVHGFKISNMPDIPLILDPMRFRELIFHQLLSNIPWSIKDLKFSGHVYKDKIHLITTFTVAWYRQQTPHGGTLTQLQLNTLRRYICVRAVSTNAAALTLDDDHFLSWTRSTLTSAYNSHLRAPFILTDHIGESTHSIYSYIVPHITCVGYMPIASTTIGYDAVTWDEIHVPRRPIKRKYNDTLLENWASSIHSIHHRRNDHILQVQPTRGVEMRHTVSEPLYISVIVYNLPLTCNFGDHTIDLQTGVYTTSTHSEKTLLLHVLDGNPIESRTCPFCRVSRFVHCPCKYIDYATFPISFSLDDG